MDHRCDPISRSPVPGRWSDRAARSGRRRHRRRRPTSTRRPALPRPPPHRGHARAAGRDGHGSLRRGGPRCSLPAGRSTAIEDVAFLAPFKWYRDEPRRLEVHVRRRPGRRPPRRRLPARSGGAALPGQPEQVTTHFTGRVVLAPTPAISARMTPPRAPAVPVAAPDAIYQRVLPRTRLPGARRRLAVKATPPSAQLATELPPNHTPDGDPLAAAPRLVELCFQTAGVAELAADGSLGLPASGPPPRGGAGRDRGRRPLGGRRPPAKMAVSTPSSLDGEGRGARPPVRLRDDRPARCRRRRRPCTRAPLESAPFDDAGWQSDADRCGLRPGGGARPGRGGAALHPHGPRGRRRTRANGSTSSPSTHDPRRSDVDRAGGRLGRRPRRTGPRRPRRGAGRRRRSTRCGRDGTRRPMDPATAAICDRLGVRFLGPDADTLRRVRDRIARQADCRERRAARRAVERRGARWRGRRRRGGRGARLPGDAQGRRRRRPSRHPARRRSGRAARGHRPRRGRGASVVRRPHAVPRGVARRCPPPRGDRRGRRATARCGRSARTMPRCAAGATRS